MSAPLALEDISAAYGEHMVLESISAVFEAGRVTGLVGANGAGKTTILRAALGLVPIGSGQVLILETPRAQMSREALARTMAYLPQASVAHWPVEARKLVALGRLPYLDSFGRIGQADLEAIDLALARCDALKFATRRIDHLSAGERARVLLARALATGAKVLLADEPAAHLDPAHQLQLMELLRDEARRGTAVIVTLHDLPLAARFCDELLIVNKGRILARGAPQSVLTEDNLAAAFGIRPLRPTDGEPFPIIPWSRI